MRIRFVDAMLLILFAQPVLSSAAAQEERKVANPTRLDWEFAGRSFGPSKVPAGYDSTSLRYQLFVPKGYTKEKSWPLVLFLSPSDQPAGFKTWQPICQEQGMFFASPRAAGNNVPLGQRTRIIADVLDDVRRNFRIDPDQTYLTGFSGGGRMACAIGFALPEYFGGVIPVCGVNPIPAPTYLRHRIEERLSVAFVTGEKDFNRKENETFLAPWFTQINIRNKLWIVPKLGHEIPSTTVMKEVYAWLAEDLPRRRADAKARPKLALSPDDAPTGPEQAKHLLDTALEDFKQPERTWRGVALLQGAAQRWPGSAAGKAAKAQLQKIVTDEKLLKLIDEQGTADEIKSVTAQAEALERFGDTAKAIQAWQILATNYADSEVGMKAAAHVKRLQGK